MDYFKYINGQLFCESVNVSEIADQIGTPAYVYSAAALRENYRAFADAFAPLSATVCFSINIGERQYS